MDWTQALTIIGVFTAFFIYLISKMDNKFGQIDSKFEHMGDRIGKIENRLTAVEAEIKSSNQRLTDFKTDMNQRLSTIEGYIVPRKVYRFEESKDEPKEN